MVSSSSFSPVPSPPPSSLSPSSSLSMITNEKKAQVSWKSQAQQQIFSSKLYQALARVNLGSALRRGKAIVLEAAGMANRMTRWSRAILTRNYFKGKLLRHKPQRIAITAPPTLSSIFIFHQLKRKKGVGAQRKVLRKVRFQARLVPGCRKQKDPVILDGLATTHQLELRLFDP